MREREQLSPLLRMDLSRFSEGEVLGGSVYEEARAGHYQEKQANLVEKKKENRILSLLRKRAPMLALSLSGFLVGCTREAPPTDLEPTPFRLKPTPEKLAICPPAPFGCSVTNLDEFVFRGEFGYEPSTRLCFQFPYQDKPGNFLVDVWTVGNDSKMANCQLSCNHRLSVEEIEVICDVDLTPKEERQRDDGLMMVSGPDYLKEEKIFPREAMSERRETGEVVDLLQGLRDKVEEIGIRRRTWLGGESHRVNPGDTLWLIGQKIGRTPEEIYLRNWWQIEDPRLIYSGQELYLPESIYPSHFLRELFLRAETDFQDLERWKETYGPQSFLAEKKAAEIWNFWHSVPREGEIVVEPEIRVDPGTGEKGEWIRREIERFLATVPDSGRVLSEVNIVPRESIDLPYRMFVYTYPDRGSNIFIVEPPPDSLDENAQWERDTLLIIFAHEFLGHSMSLYSGGYNLGWLKPVQIIDLVYEQTILWDGYYRPSGEGQAFIGFSEEERNAEYVDIFFENGEAETFFFQYLDPEKVKPFEDHYNRLISANLGYPFTLDDLALKLAVR